MLVQFIKKVVSDIENDFAYQICINKITKEQNTKRFDTYL